MSKQKQKQQTQKSDDTGSDWLTSDIDPLQGLADIVSGKIFDGPETPKKNETKKAKENENNEIEDDVSDSDDSNRVKRPAPRGTGDTKRDPSGGPITLNIFNADRKRSERVTAPKAKGKAAGKQEPPEDSDDESDESGDDE